MQDIINGKKYDTATAELVVSRDNGLNLTDFYYVREDLYKTSKGNWFIHANRGGRESIVPIDPSHAWEWLINHGHVAKAEEYFGNIEEA